MSADRRILFVSPQVPFPLDTGGKIRTFYQLRALAREYQVDLLCLSDPADEDAEKAPVWQGMKAQLRSITCIPREGTRRPGQLKAAWRGFWGPLPYPVEKYRSTEAASWIRHHTHHESCDAVHFDSLHTFRFASEVKTGIPVCLDEHNVEALILERMTEVSPWWKQGLVKQQAALTDSFERHCALRADRVFLCSQPDRDLLAARTGYHDNLRVIPNGVELQRLESGRWSGVEEHPRSVVFLGSMDWWPNQDGIAWFMEETWPLIQQHRPDLVLKVVGRNPSRALQKTRVPGVEVLGGVPDIRPYVASASAFVVPLRVGGGTRLKILEAFAIGAPVISTSVGCEGIAVEDGKHLLIGDSPGALCDHVLSLVQNHEMADGLRREGRALVEGHYSWGAIGRRLCAEYESIWRS